VDEDQESKRTTRPRRMTNVTFPPAKYGVYLAIAIIAVMVVLMLLDAITS
jgi:hypothetical protein